MKNKLKEIRKEKGYTQEEVARKAGISLRNYINIENNFQEPGLRTAYMVAKALGCDIETIFEIEPKKEYKNEIKNFKIAESNSKYLNYIVAFKEE